VPSCGLKKRTPSSVTFASLRRDTIWKLTSESATGRVLTKLVGSPTHHYLHPSAPKLGESRGPLQAPVRMLCGHDWNLCAPPIASSVACPGLRPLPHVSFMRHRDSIGFVQMVRVVQTQTTSRFFELIWRKAFQGSLRGYRHKDGEGYRAMRKMEGCGASFCDLRLRLDWSIDMGIGETSLSTFLEAQMSGPRASTQAPCLSFGETDVGNEKVERPAMQGSRLRCGPC
jgi:hypothetical protein